MTSAPSPILRAQGLSRRVPGDAGPLDILSGVDLAIAPGDTLAIVGASGSGKSTLLGLLAGLERPSAGRVWLDGVDLATLDEDGLARLRGRLLGFVFQSFQLLPAFTALENVMLPLELARRPTQGARALLQRVGLGERLHHTPRQLSGGEQQRVALARAFATEPRILMADEPTGNLDAATGAAIIDLLFELNREHHTTLVLVTHDEQLAARCAHRLHLAGGRIVEAAT